MCITFSFPSSELQSHSTNNNFVERLAFSSQPFQNKNCSVSLFYFMLCNYTTFLFLYSPFTVQVYHLRNLTDLRAVLLNTTVNVYSERRFNLQAYFKQTEKTDSPYWETTSKINKERDRLHGTNCSVGLGTTRRCS